MLTQKQIAEKLGVSQGIVSHIIAGRRPVRTKLHRKIMKECQSGKYQINQAARSLRTGKSQNLALVLPDFSFLDTFNRTIVQGLWQAGLEHNYSLTITCMESDPDLHSDYIKLIQQNRVDGLFFLQNIEQTDVQQLNDMNMPFIFVNTPHLDDSISYACANGTQGVYEAVSHLVNVHNYRRIAFAARETDSPLFEDRYRGYVMALEQAGIEIRDELVIPISKNGSFIQQGNIAAKFLLSHLDEFDAVMCTSDDICHRPDQHLQSP